MSIRSYHTSDNYYKYVHWYTSKATYYLLERLTLVVLVTVNVEDESFLCGCSSSILDGLVSTSALSLIVVYHQGNPRISSIDENQQISLIYDSRTWMGIFLEHFRLKFNGHAGEFNCMPDHMINLTRYNGIFIM